MPHRRPTPAPHRSRPAQLTAGAEALCTQRLERARRYVLLMGELRESAWRPADERQTTS